MSENVSSPPHSDVPAGRPACPVCGRESNDGLAPFANLPERGGLLTAAQMRFCKWIEPELVCQVRFTEWTDDGMLRHPVFLGLRHDKAAKDVVRESPPDNGKRNNRPE